MKIYSFVSSESNNNFGSIAIPNIKPIKNITNGESKKEAKELNRKIKPKENVESKNRKGREKLKNSGCSLLTFPPSLLTDSPVPSLFRGIAILVILYVDCSYFVWDGKINVSVITAPAKHPIIPKTIGRISFFMKKCPYCIKIIS